LLILKLTRLCENTYAIPVTTPNDPETGDPDAVFEPGIAFEDIFDD
jgi:hypothetical protein